MGVIVELSVPAAEFQLGRILAVEGDVTITLKKMVPLGERPVPLFQVSGTVNDAFESRVRDHPTVADIHVVNTHDGETLYALDWEIGENTFLDSVTALDGHVLEATANAGNWVFQIRFDSHQALSAFHEACFDDNVPVNVLRIFNPTKPDAGPWYGLTESQRETLSYAVEQGYYSIPRQCSTLDIAEEFDISDQAATERLRRAIYTLVSNTLLLTAGND
jgi:predicted DNA binding protein